MTFSARARLVNPRLGTFFSIFASLFAALFLLNLILEQLQVADASLRAMMFAGPLLLFAGTGLIVTTQDQLSYFAAGRRVPAGYTGLILATSAIGSTILVCGTGAMFFDGFDALVLMIGGLAGFVVMAIMLAPFYRKFGAYTVPSYLGRRFDSKLLRLSTAMVAIVPALLVLAAELSVGAKVMSRLTGYGVPGLIFLEIIVLSVAIAPGGMRSFTWSGVAQAIALLLALVIVATVVSVLETSLPVSQLAHGPMVRNMVRNEVSQGLPVVITWPLAFSLPQEGFHAISKSYAQPFGSVGPVSFVLGALVIAMGTAAAPWLLPRVAGAPGVYESRKALGWATVFFGVILLTLTAFAVFLRNDALDAVMNERVGTPPQWLTAIIAAGFAKMDGTAAQLTFSSMLFDRDAVIFATPLAAGLPQAVTYLMYAGAVAASLVAAGATVISVASILSEDVVQGLSWEPSTDSHRVWTTRAFVPLAGLAGGALALLAPTDPLRLFMWALALTGASLFPVLGLSVWWKRMTPMGAIAGISSGFIVAALAVFASEANIIAMPSMISGILGFPVATAAVLLVSAFLPETSRHILEVVRDIRVPGGQIIYDREMQRLQLRKHSRSG